MTSRLPLIAAAVAILIVGVLIGAACGDDDEAGAQNGITQEQIDAVALDAQRAHVLATMTTIRVEGLHEIDEEAVQAAEIEAGWSGSITRIRQAVAGTEWPADLHDMAEELETELMAVEDAIADDDLAATKTAISMAHAAWHDLEHPAYSFAAGEEMAGDHGDAADH
jgi:hypothetical protein